MFVMCSLDSYFNMNQGMLYWLRLIVSYCPACVQVLTTKIKQYIPACHATCEQPHPVFCSPGLEAEESQFTGTV